MDNGWKPFGRLLASKGAGGEEGVGEVGDTLIDSFIEAFLVKDDDAVVLGMQMAVGTLLFVLHVYFEFLKICECMAVLPSKWVLRSSGGVAHCWEKTMWDPRKQGTPFLYRITGMPAMWFTSKETLQDLVRYVSEARGSLVGSLCPQEIAFLVLSGDEGRIEVQQAFMNSKLFSARTSRLVCEGAEMLTGESRFSKLNIKLLFYDSDKQAAGFEYPGEFSDLTDGEGEGNESRSVLVRSHGSLVGGGGSRKSRRTMRLRGP